MKPQPFSPPVEEVRVWAVPRDAAEELCAILYAYITWGKDKHPSQVSETEYKAWDSVKERWRAGTQKLLDMLADVGHIEWAEPIKRPIQYIFKALPETIKSGRPDLIRYEVLRSDTWEVVNPRATLEECCALAEITP